MSARLLLATLTARVAWLGLGSGSGSGSGLGLGLGYLGRQQRASKRGTRTVSTLCLTADPGARAAMPQGSRLAGAPERREQPCATGPCGRADGTAAVQVQRADHADAYPCQHSSGPLSAVPGRVLLDSANRLSNSSRSVKQGRSWCRVLATRAVTCPTRSRLHTAGLPGKSARVGRVQPFAHAVPSRVHCVHTT